MTSPGDDDSQAPPVLSASNDLGKRKRNSRACDRCHRNACKCSPGIEGVPCTRCEEQGITCTYNRPSKRRGPPPRRSRVDSDATTAAQQPQPEPEAADDSEPGATPVQFDAEQDDQGSPPALPVQPPDAPLPEWLYHFTVKHQDIESLLGVFYQSCYVLRPYFHWPTFQSQVQQSLYRLDRGLFAVTMAVCALASGRLHNGMPVPESPHPLRLEAVPLFTACYSAATGAIPSDLMDIEIQDRYQMMKAKAILGSCCLQNGDLKRAITHLGDYTTLLSISGFNIESNWPTNISERERQERRRLFWGAYQQDQYISHSFGFISRIREAKTSVKYPAEVFDDVDITETGILQRPDKVSFLRGWNFCTDLYRLLQYLDDTFKTQQQFTRDEPGSAVSSLLSRLRSPKNFSSEMLHLISDLHAELPDELKRVKAITGDPQSDRYGLIAANILITTQTLKMVLVSSGKPNIHLRCAAASELLDELSTIPIEFFYAMNTVSLHHLANVGHLLGNVTQSSLSAWSYLQIRNILIVLAEFLEKIEARRDPPPGLAIKLRSEIDHLDQRMKQNPSTSSQGLSTIGQNLLESRSNASSEALTSFDNVAQPSQEGIANNGVLGEASSTMPGAARPAQTLDGDQHSTWPMPQPHMLPSTWNDTSQYPLNPIPGSSLPNPTHDTAASNDLSRDQPIFDDLFHTWSFLIGQPDNLDPADSFAALGMMPQDAYRTSLAPRSTNEANDTSGGNMHGV
ncbi:hypothetical protein CDV31_007224 [Fusarium ambrosium]|uniref:Zn(2)-C6 fungal-type domain-containing protein n=1 Tax=Fusarium ambrosium TaxID=131363 RepID=A0A428U7Z8_9HYPO|nr:hypothetical protein CDV31_007224 [Fusarium ambrosium]